MSNYSSTPGRKSTNTENQVLYARDFGANPSHQDNAPALRRAVDACRGRRNVTLVIDPGDYRFRDEDAIHLMQRVMSGEYGHNPEKRMFHPYASYVAGLAFRGVNGLTVQAAGARLLCDGWMEPISLVDCTNATIRGLAVDYARKPFSIGRVVGRGIRSFDVEIDRAFPVAEGTPTPRVEFWDVAKDTLHPHAVYVKRKSKLIGPQMLRVHGVAPQGEGPYDAMIVHTVHFRPAILIRNSTDVVLEDVTIHSQPGMGIVGHRSHNITLRRVSVIPSEGLHMSTNTDATHFTTCTGLIHFRECRFEGQGDDSTNIHNYYYSILDWSPPDGCTITVRAPTGTHAQILDHPDPGDTLEIVDKNTLGVEGCCTVLSVENDPEQWQSRIRISGDIPLQPHTCFLANVTRLPKVEIKDCAMRHHLARGVLIKSRDVRIEGCEISETTGTGIHVGPEAWWHEGVATRNVTIVNNRIVGCGRGNGQIDGTSGIAVTVEAAEPSRQDIHRHIMISDNTIEVKDKATGILVSNATDVHLARNKISGTDRPLHIRYCAGVSLDDGDSATLGPGVSNVVRA